MIEEDCNLEEVTIKDVCISHRCTLTELSRDMHCSISLLSKIQNNNEYISDRTQEKFQKLFPGFKLVNGVLKYKDLYKEALNDLKEADNIINNLEAELLAARVKLDAIKDIINKKE